MAENALGVLLACDGLGADVVGAAAALAEFAPQQGRGARLTLTSASGPFTVIDESYNANPASMRAALALLGAVEPAAAGRRIAVIGDMLELGPDGATMHAALATELARNGVDLLFGAGPLTRALYDAAPPLDARRLGRAVQRHSSPSRRRVAWRVPSWAAVQASPLPSAARL